MQKIELAAAPIRKRGHWKKIGMPAAPAVIVLIVVIMFMMFFCGCTLLESSSPDELAIEANGETITALEIVNGTEGPQLTACISPDDYSGEILWENNDGGVVRISDTDGRNCTLSILKSGTARITVTCGEKTASVKVTVEKNQEQLSERETAYFINDMRYSAEMLNLYYVDAYNSFIEEYGEYASYYGLDTESGLSGLDGQSCDYSDDGTWRGYFLETACSNLLYSIALCDWADENGCTLDEEKTYSIRIQMENVEKTASEAGYASTDEYLEAFYGTGINTVLYEEFISRMALAELAYETYHDSLSYTDDELSDHYMEMGYEDEDNEYPTVSMRHILVMAEADEDGTYSEEAISAAHEKAMQIYDEWLAGAATEESFSSLVIQYSEDTASVSAGGLYENIAKGEMIDAINEWLFSADRKSGDTTVVDNNGSYVGSHVVYFCGSGEIYSQYLARNDLIDTDISNWLDSLLDHYTAEEGDDYKNAGVF